MRCVSKYGSIWDQRSSLTDCREYLGSASCFTIQTNACQRDGVKLALTGTEFKVVRNRLLLLEIDSVTKVQLSGEHPGLQERTGKPPWWSAGNRCFVVLRSRVVAYESYLIFSVPFQIFSTLDSVSTYRLPV